MLDHGARWKFRPASWVLCMWLAFVAAIPVQASEANRLTYLDEPLSPYHVGLEFPKLTTPQWVGQPGVEAVVVLAIDDMRDVARYESYLRPILERLKQIDGRAPVSIMTNRVDPQDPQLQQWLREGLSIEVHTYDHPCPCLQGGDFAKARQTYDQCVDLLAQIPNMKPVAFRMPCCDSLNTPSPRFWNEIFNRTTPAGNYLAIDSSVFQVFTPADRELPESITRLEDGSSRFRRYIPFPSFVNTIEDYPYPYVIGRMCWQFPCMVPSDWEAQHVQQPNNPRTVEDMCLALDATVHKQGVFNLVFHPHGWIRNDQVVQLIDHAVQRHGNKVLFLTFHEALQRINEHLLAGTPLRNEQGRDQGVRMLDINGDRHLDVVIGAPGKQQTRLWNPQDAAWLTRPFPLQIVDDHGRATGVQFGICPRDRRSVVALVANAQQRAGYRFREGTWQAANELLNGLSIDGREVVSQIEGRDQGLRWRDIDDDGATELIASGPQCNQVFQWDSSKQVWQSLGYGLPGDVRLVKSNGLDAGTRFIDVDHDGHDDVVFSNELQYSVDLFQDLQHGWALRAREGQRDNDDAVPMIVRGDTNNGAWFHSGQLWVQNEDTNRLPDHVQRMPLTDMLPRPADGTPSDADQMPTALTPEQSLAAIQVRAGLTVQLVAAEPLIADPVAFDWGSDGRLWVVEMRDYPNGLDGQGKPGGRVKVLSDTDGDGVYDQVALFLDDLPFPTGIKVWRQGVLITAAPEIIYAEDRDGDDKADHRETLFRGFAEGNQQHRVNGLRWGLDNWLHLANGDSGGSVESLRTGQRAEIGGRDLRIRPDQGAVEPTSGQTQFGRDRDDWGNWFGGNNSNPVWHYLLEDRYLRRNPHLAVPSLRHQISEQPGAASIFPVSRTLARFNDFDKANRFTSACSPTVYRDRWLGDTFYGNVLICEPVHNLVHRHVLQADGISFVGRRAEDERQSEFLASTDNWFRPVMVRTGPDGAVWIADMYRLVIEHPEWIPQAWQQRLNLRDGDDRGRIYRVFATARPPRPMPRLDSLDASQLVALLEHENGWQRDMAQQMLLWRHDLDCVSMLRNLLQQSPSASARLHALCTLDGLEQLEPGDVSAALADQDPAVRRHAVRLSETWIADSAELQQRAVALVDDPDPHVRLQLAYSLGSWPHPDAAPALAALALTPAHADGLQWAALSSLNADQLPHMLSAVLQQRGEQPPVKLVRQLLALAKATDQPQVAASILKEISAPRWAASHSSADGELADMLDALGAVDWRSLVDETTRNQIEDHMAAARQTVQDTTADEPDRIRALRLVGRQTQWFEEDLKQLESLLVPQSSVSLQHAVVNRLSEFTDPGIAEVFLADWSSKTPALRAEILDVVLARPRWTAELLTAIDDQRIRAADLDARTVGQLQQHSDAKIRERAATLLAASIDENRQAVLDQFAAAAEIEGDAVRGRPLFLKHCANCHRWEDQGHAVGPDLAALTDRSATSMLVAILDPNRAVEDKYREFLVVTVDGRQFTGILAGESSNSVTLAAQEGKQQTILRNQIDVMQTTGRSLMPEGVEKDLTAQDLADVMALVRQLKPPRKSFPGNSPQVAPMRDDGSIRLLAMHSQVHGPTLVFEPQYRNLGWWQSQDDFAIWDLEVPRSRRYRVVVEYACHDDAAGDRFVLAIGDQTLGAAVPGTGTWDQYRSLTLGTVELPAGRLQAVMRSDGPIRSALIDLASIRLLPVD